MRNFFMLLVMLLMSVNVIAKGTIAGKVSDEKTGEPIIGATVMIQGTSLGTATDVDGRFTLSADAGDYVIEIKYIGYQQKDISDVVVKEGKVTELNAVISEDDKKTLKEVVVKASLKKESISALYVMQKNSVSVSSGISADVIQRTPDRNTGEVLKRVSGASVKDGKYVVIRGLSDRYNLAMVNNALMPSTEPDKKAFSFDVIPSNLIDNIIITKTATPDLPGDFAGGVVQVLTKDVPEQDFFNLSLALGYNTQSTFKPFTSNERGAGDYLGFSSVNKPLPSAFGGDRAEFELQSERASKALPNTYKAVTNSALPNTTLQVSYGKAKHFGNGDKLGIVAGLSYRNSYATSDDYLRGKYQNDYRISSLNNDVQYKVNTNLAGLLNFAYVTGRSKFSLKNLYNRIADENHYTRGGYTTGSDQQIKMSSTIPSERQVLNSQLEGEHAIGAKNLKVNWNLNYSNLNADQNDLRTAYYSRGVSFDGNDEPVVNESEPFRIIDRNSRRFFAGQNDNTFGGNINATYPFQAFNQKQSLKVGYLGQYKTRTFSARTFQYKSYSANLDHEVETLPVNEIFEPSNVKPGGFLLEEITSPNDAYDASGLLNAGFAMLDNNLSDKWRLTWGVRFEAYSQNLQAIDRSGKEVDQTDVFNDVLPSANLSYSFNEKSKLRLGASRTVNRPEFREIAPFQFIDFENLWTIAGNPNLKRANINNIDLRYDFYPSPGEALTVGVFYKNFENPIENKLDDQSNLDLMIFSYSNAKSANAVGAELDLRKNLSFISNAKWLENLVVGANLTYIYSKVDVGNITGTAVTRPLQGQSPYLVNLSLLYSDAERGLAFSALYNRIGERIAVVGSRDIPTTWENGRDVIDVQISKSVLNKKGELKLTVGDILNQPTTYYWNTDNINGYKSGPSKVGIGNDQIFQQYRFGTTFTVGFSYKLGK